MDKNPEDYPINPSEAAVPTAVDTEDPSADYAGLGDSHNHVIEPR